MHDPLRPKIHHRLRCGSPSVTAIGAGVLAVVLTACGGQPGGAPPVTDLTGEPSGRQPAVVSGMGYPRSEFHRRDALLAHLGSWADTPHRLGGTGRSGIDCSAFTAVTYRDVFDVDLPRTTTDQANLGRPVALEELEPGDLVFFKTESGRHVGVYTGNGEFMHASSSQGVTSSSLSSPYWSRRYWKANRVMRPTLALAEQ
ncbi:MAG: NlpC/P60 family protein [Gammaproteobacteria bacterium]